MDIDALIDANVGRVPDFPKLGITFYDINPLLQGHIFNAIIDNLVAVSMNVKYDLIVGVESRGFIFASAVASQTNTDLVLARKAGKLPPPVDRESYQLEYGSGIIEIQKTAMEGHKRALIIDDLYATGGTVEAVASILTRNGIEVSMCMGIIGLPELGYSNKLGKVPIYVQKQFKEN